MMMLEITGKIRETRTWVPKQKPKEIVNNQQKVIIDYHYLYFRNMPEFHVWFN
jgi:hypothetical protein